MIVVFIYNCWYKGFNHQYLLLRLLLLSFSFEESFEAALDSHNCPHFDLYPAQREKFFVLIMIEETSPAPNSDLDPWGREYLRVEHLVVGLCDLQSIGLASVICKAKNITAELVLFLSTFAVWICHCFVIMVRLNVIHGEEESVLHPPVFARLGPVWNNVDFCTKRIELQKFYLLRTFCAELCTRVFWEIKVAHVHVEVCPNEDWNTPVIWPGQVAFSLQTYLCIWQNQHQSMMNYNLSVTMKSMNSLQILVLSLKGES